MTAPTSADESVAWGTRRARWVLLATVLGSSITFLDATVVNVALPTIGTELAARVGYCWLWERLFAAPQGQSWGQSRNVPNCSCSEAAVGRHGDARLIPMIARVE